MMKVIHLKNRFIFVIFLILFIITFPLIYFCYTGVYEDLLLNFSLKNAILSFAPILNIFTYIYLVMILVYYFIFLKRNNFDYIEISDDMIVIPNIDHIFFPIQRRKFVIKRSELRSIKEIELSQSRIKAISFEPIKFRQIHITKIMISDEDYNFLKSEFSLEKEN